MHSASEYVNNGVFTVQIYGVELSFSKVSGISSSVEYDTFTEGGGRMHLFVKPKTTAGVITLERGISVVDVGFAMLLQAGCRVSDIVINLEKNGKTVECYYIESGLVTSWELGELSGMAGGVAVKTFSIAHTGLKAYL